MSQICTGLGTNAQNHDYCATKRCTMAVKFTVVLIASNLSLFNYNF